MADREQLHDLRRSARAPNRRWRSGKPRADRRPAGHRAGVDANASEGHLDDVARRLGIAEPGNQNKDDLVRETEKANSVRRSGHGGS